VTEAAQLLIVALAILGSAFYSGLETGVVSINRLRLRHLIRHKVKGADILLDFLVHPDHLLGTMLVGNNLCNVVASVTAVSLGAHLMGTAGYTIGYAALTLIMLMFGEYLPKAWFQALPAERSLPFAKLLQINGYIFYPVSRVMTALARLLVPVPASREDQPRPFVTKEELKHLTTEGERSGALTSDERRMIHSVFELTHKACRDIMVPRENFNLVHDDTPRDEILEIARTKSISRLPVFDGFHDSPSALTPQRRVAPGSLRCTVTSRISLSVGRSGLMLMRARVIGM